MSEKPCHSIKKDSQTQAETQGEQSLRGLRAKRSNQQGEAI
jgi:hypothetical protein